MQASNDIINKRIQQIISIHFDERNGAAYWLEKQRRLGINAIRQIHALDDLAMLGPMDQHTLSERPIEDFIPRCYSERRSEFLPVETGGTLGQPKFAVHRRDEFQEAFIEPFIRAAKVSGFPEKLNWLFIGPTGPHIIGHAARQCARALDSSAPFCIDFDPRWAKKLPEASFAARRYLNHIVEQALRILKTQRIGVIFGTPAVLGSLGEELSLDIRKKIMGIHLGGMSVSHPFRTKLQELFPSAQLLSGYGNTLFGMAPELAYNKETGIDYYPYGSRVVLQCIELSKNDQKDEERLHKQVEYGQRGQILAHRLDETQFIANMIERDTAIRIPARAEAVKSGFILDGIRDPQPLQTPTLKPAVGLY